MHIWCKLYIFTPNVNDKKMNSKGFPIIPLKLITYPDIITQHIILIDMNSDHRSESSELITFIGSELMKMIEPFETARIE